MRKVSVLLMALGLLCALAPAAGAATEMCVTIYENGSNGGDAWSRCSTNPTSIKISNLTNYANNLVNGCQDIAPPTNPNWNDCVSSVKITNKPVNYSVEFYDDSNYLGLWVMCFNNNNAGYTLGGIFNDSISSFRVLARRCP
jgi:hypothetical protein